MYKRFLKPAIDFSCAIIALIIASPIMILLFLAIPVFMKVSPIFSQERAGKNDKRFFIYKFKSMTEERDVAGNLLDDEQRLTAFGKVLRKSSLDELPQLFNILKGEMSFIGPRPLPPQYLELYSPAHKQRHGVTPGISGWAQVNGRNAISWNKKFDLDVWYVRHQSVVLDLKILFKTIAIVLTSKDINTDGVATTIPYNGKN